ncbi:hypothetical protein FDP41_007449 [Naegleria fowleri]|uniref:Uncharacterized protein n=1 Tax=Naegleria fowleri TaxID=5763 RepID=A0A6A5CB65_NAEFO|nr:uncharacterized protein FDP41_007449 [Naegleria fowleri]KAF0984272.1 hypothetical protein FDP41_007449 [Naegleria fowleri]
MNSILEDSLRLQPLVQVHSQPGIPIDLKLGKSHIPLFMTRFTHMSVNYRSFKVYPRTFAPPQPAPLPTPKPTPKPIPPSKQPSVIPSHNGTARTLDASKRFESVNRFGMMNGHVVVVVAVVMTVEVFF